MIAYVAIALLCYITGSIPTAYILVKAVKGVDIRTVGSGNIGATNAGRALGGWAFATVLVLDALKGYLAVFLTARAVIAYGLLPHLILLAALAVILGHSYSIFLKFKGGKGVATGLGVCLALVPVPIAIALVVFIVIVLITRMVSVGSICAAITLGIVVSFAYTWALLIAFIWLAVTFVIYKHIPNIKRIIAGTESKVKFRK